MFDLRTDAGIKAFQNAVTCNDEDGDSDFNRIEVTWPFPMLEVIIQCIFIIVNTIVDIIDGPTDIFLCYYNDFELFYFLT